MGLDALLDQGRLPGPDFIKMDVEGVEGEALRGAEKLLAQHRPVILLSLHGAAAKQDTPAFLERLGYQLTHVNKSTVIAAPKAA